MWSREVVGAVNDCGGDGNSNPVEGTPNRRREGHMERRRKHRLAVNSPIRISAFMNQRVALLYREDDREEECTGVGMETG
ncbi:hypothetical protein L2E82_13759 [Cichorium intybus]|uniref:Uncharacterized protein n=1 Tax=Cichorium intybus TaxID=13427 RepID=A0ACB9EY48_CICIN|nr:hypothetical protein L2E82_13759 [Cichorium intybus]